MSKKEREKGKRGERAWAKVCREYGFDCRRTSQYCGQTGDAADVVGIPGIHQEVKFVERLNVQDAMDQAKRDAAAKGNGDMPIVAHKKSNCEWLVTMPAWVFFELLKEWKDSYEESQD